MLGTLGKNGGGHFHSAVSIVGHAGLIECQGNQGSVVLNSQGHVLVEEVLVSLGGIDYLFAGNLREDFLHNVPLGVVDSYGDIRGLTNILYEPEQSADGIACGGTTIDVQGRGTGGDLRFGQVLNNLAVFFLDGLFHVGKHSIYQFTDDIHS